MTENSLNKTSENKKVTASALLIGLFTIFSRILGYIRDMVIAFIFGAGMSADAFFVAFRLSNLLRRLVGEGAMTSSFVPVFTSEMEKYATDEDKGRPQLLDLVSKFFTFFFIILVVLTLTGIFFADFLVALMSPGFIEGSDKFQLTVSLTKLMFPYMIFIGLMAVAMGVLNSYRHFGAPALAPVLLNISIITFALVSYYVEGLFTHPVYALATGVLVGGVLQFMLQVPYLAKVGMIPRPKVCNYLKEPAIKKILTLMGPALLGVGVYQINIFVTMRFASTLSEGSVSYLYYASRLMELPLGVFAVAVANAMLPTMSSFAARGDMASLKDSLAFSMKMVNFIIIPSMIGFIILSVPIVDVLFKRGEFGTGDVNATAYALIFYALGLIPVAGARVLVSVFYALKDTKTPLWGAAVALVVNIVMCIMLMEEFKHGGLALATSIAAFVNYILLMIFVNFKIGGMSDSKIFYSGVKTVISSLVMGGVVSYGLKVSNFTTYSGLTSAGILALLITLGIAVYILMSKLLKSEEYAYLVNSFKKKV